MAAGSVPTTIDPCYLHDGAAAASGGRCSLGRRSTALKGAVDEAAVRAPPWTPVGDCRWRRALGSGLAEDFLFEVGDTGDELVALGVAQVGFD